MEAGKQVIYKFNQENVYNQKPNTKGQYGKWKCDHLYHRFYGSVHYRDQNCYQNGAGISVYGYSWQQPSNKIND